MKRGRSREVQVDDTLPKLLVRNLRKYASHRVAMRKKDAGIWWQYTWKDYYENVKSFSLGLLSLGLEPHDKVVILGDSDPEWFWAELAVQAVGGVAVGIYPDATPGEIKYFINDSDSKFAVVQDQEQVDKILQLGEILPKIKRVIYWEYKGLHNYDDPILVSFEQVQQLGKEYEQANPGFFEQSIEKAKGDDISYLCYTSGTTILSKGMQKTYGNQLSDARILSRTGRYRETDEYVSSISPAWQSEQISIAAQLDSSFVVSFPEKVETVQEDIRDIGPTIVFYSARMWESLASSIDAKITITSPLRRFIYNLALAIGYKMVDFVDTRRKPSLFWNAVYKLADMSVFKPTRDKVGLARVKHAYTMAVLSPQIFRFFSALGVRLETIYGTTEGGLNTLAR